jgi:hypothetical protein
MNINPIQSKSSSDVKPFYLDFIQWGNSQQIQSNYKAIKYAQTKLTQDHIPLSIRAISYIRICCNQIRKISNFAVPIYGNLLENLMKESVDWWQTCYVNQEQLLKSNNHQIDQLLQPLNTFVQILNFSCVDHQKSEP